jgi:hypothetical protein
MSIKLSSLLTVQQIESSNLPQNPEGGQLFFSYGRVNFAFPRQDWQRQSGSGLPPAKTSRNDSSRLQAFRL